MRPTRTLHVAKLATFVIFALLFLTASDAFATSAFARKYGVTCQTCHVAYPKLNAYGTAFRNLGYRLPGKSDAEAPSPDLPLGSPAYKKVWPKAVWPGGLPSQLPLALVTDFEVRDSQAVDETGALAEVEAQFLMPSQVALIASGTAGDVVSYFGEIAFTQDLEEGEVVSEVEVEHFDVRFVRPFRNSSAFNLKVGAFQPELVETFDHARRLTLANYDAMFSVDPVQTSVAGGGHHGGGSIALPAISRGFEAFGFVKGRLTWAAGLVSGIGPDGVFDGNSSKDVYGRLGYKWGGLALDGSNADSYAGSRKNWRERSLRFNVFAYRGDASGIFGELEGEHVEDEPHDDSQMAIVLSSTAGDEIHDDDDGDGTAPNLFENPSSTRYGFDFNWTFDDLNVFGAWVSGEDELRLFIDDGGHRELLPSLTGQRDYEAWFIEANLVLGYPWLVGVARIEGVDFASAADNPRGQDWRRATISVTGLLRANLKCVLEHTRDLNVSKNYSTSAALSLVF